MKQLVSHRLDSELLAWATTYAKSRGTSRAVVIEAALESMQRDSETGVPDLPVADSPSAREARSRAVVVDVDAAQAEYARNIAARQARLNEAKARASR